MRHTPWRLMAPATLCAALLAGCASAPDRSEIFISTTPPGASCTLSRLGQSIATAEPTPAIALVEPSDSEIAILCRRNGFADAAVTLAAHRTEPGFGLAIGRWPYEYQHRVDIALTPKRP
jgi:ABC-type uncharacterized transport system auxiliary subunit